MLFWKLSIVEVGGVVHHVTLFLDLGHPQIKITDVNLKVYFENVKYLTGIDIKTLGDLETVVKELEFRKDKFQENFSKPKQSGSKVYLMQIVLGVFSFMNQPVNLDMTIPEFAIMRDEANEKLKREKTK